MKSILALATSLLLVSYCDAETFSVNATDPNYPGMCFYKNNAYPPGEFQLPHRCIRLICSPNGWVSGHGCIVSTLEGCFRGQENDINKPFPECCKRTYTCRHGDGTEYNLIDY